MVTNLLLDGQSGADGQNFVTVRDRLGISVQL